MNPCNLKILKKHQKACENSICPCNLSKSSGFTSNFVPFSFICDIKPTKIFRVHMRVQLRIMFLNYLLFKYNCINCGQGIYQQENKCCDLRDMQIKVIGGGVAEDSTGIVDCEIHGIENIAKLMGFSGVVLEDIRVLILERGESYLNYRDMPDSLKKTLKNLGPIFKFCIIKPEYKQKSQNSMEMFNNCVKGFDEKNMVMLNSSKPGIQAQVKILKVFD